MTKNKNLKKKYNKIIKKFMDKFGNLKLYPDRPTIIAEAGVNHGCSIKLAKKYVNLVSKAKADAIKFQTYKAELIASKNSPAYWDTSEEKTKSQYKLFKNLINLILENLVNLKIM